MTRLSKGLLTWLVVPLHLAMGIIPTSGLLLCVGPGHFDIEAPHTGVPCHSAPHEQAPKRGCIDVAVVGVPVDRPASVASPLPAPTTFAPVFNHPVLGKSGAFATADPPPVGSPHERQSLAALRTVVLLS